MFLFLLVIGCQEVKEEALEKKLESTTSGKVGVDLEKGDITIETEEGSSVKIEGFKEGEWCPKDAQISISSTDGVLVMNILGIVESGEFVGLCHKLAELKGVSGKTIINLYVDENGKGFQVIESDEQIIQQEYQE